MKDTKEIEEASLKLNTYALKMAGFEKKLKTNLEIAEAIGVSESQFYKVWKGHPPGPKFIAGVLRVFGEPFERFFFLPEDES